MPRNSPLPKIALIAAVWVAAALRMYRLDFQSIWWDEGHSIAMASASLSQIATLPGMDVHPPGYFWALHIWMALFGLSEFSLRFLSLAFSLLTVTLTARFARELMAPDRKKGWYAAALTGLLAAIYPFSIAYAQEVRMYAAIIFLTTLSTYALWHIVSPTHDVPITRTGRWRWVAIYPLATAAALYTHYFFVFVVVFQNLVWLAWAMLLSPSSRERRTRILMWLGTQAGVLALFAPQLRLALAQTTSYANPNLLPPHLGAYLSRCWHAFSIGQTAVSSLQQWTASLMAGLSLLLVILLLIAKPYPTRARVAFLLAWLLVPLGLYFGVLQLRPSFEPRYLALVTPAVLLVWGWGIVELAAQSPGAYGRRWQQLLDAAAACIILLPLAAGTHSYFTNAQSFKDDSQGVVAWLTENSTSQDIVYVDVPHPFHYYASRIPAPTEYLFVDVHTIAEKLNAEASSRERLFWVTWRGSDTDPRGVVPFMLDKAGTRLGDQDFRGYHVKWWQLPPQPRFSLPDNLTPSSFVFGGFLSLDGVAFNDAADAGEEVFITCHFSLITPTDLDLRASLRLRDANGQMLLPTDKDILNDRHFRTSAWPIDDSRLNQAINVYTLAIPPDTSPGNYQLEMVVYDANGLDPIWVSDPASTDGISAPLGQVRIQPRD
jgi:mannosyltransferase